jgi:hypothetical protein
LPEAPKLAKATLQEISWTKSGTVEMKNVAGNKTEAVEVQFNPATLKVNYSNQKAGGDQPSGSPVQFVGKGTTKLTLELVFDTTILEQKGPGGPPADVRLKTQEIFNFMKPTPAPGSNKKKQFIPPGVRFHWGSFLFDGVIDSMDENLEYFSSSGVPMRATVSLSLSQQELQFQVGAAEAEAAGTSPFEEAKSGDSVQQMAAKAATPTGRAWRWPTDREPADAAPGTLSTCRRPVSASLGGLAVGGAARRRSFALRWRVDRRRRVVRRRLDWGGRRRWRRRVRRGALDAAPSFGAGAGRRGHRGGGAGRASARTPLWRGASACGRAARTAFAPAAHQPRRRAVSEGARWRRSSTRWKSSSISPGAVRTRRRCRAAEAARPGRDGRSLRPRPRAPNTGRRCAGGTDWSRAKAGSCRSAESTQRGRSSSSREEKTASRGLLSCRSRRPLRLYHCEAVFSNWGKDGNASFLVLRSTGARVRQEAHRGGWRRRGGQIFDGRITAMEGRFLRDGRTRYSCSPKIGCRTCA